jgi:coenzyme F420 hydrogenase subunit beta
MTRGLKELREEILETGACTGCGTCLHLCPQIVSIEDRIAVLGDCRIDSGRCYQYCPRTDPDPEIRETLYGDGGYGGPVGPYLEYGIARSALSHTMKVFQYGGITSALMIHAMERGLIDRAIVTKAAANLPVPVTARNPQGVIDAAGAKFALSPTNGEANRSALTPETRIGVVALPCQALGLRKRQLLPRKDGIAEGQIALIIGLFCTWALEQRGWRSLIHKHCGAGEIRRIDVPPPPAREMVITADEKQIIIPLDEVKQHVRSGCQVCLDMTAENADISVGMVEGQEAYNTVIVRTDLGKRLLEDALDAGQIHVNPLDRDHWDHLNEASMAKKTRAVAEAKNRKDSIPFYSRVVALRENIRQWERRHGK